jgi:hypothetical protein
MGRQNLPKISNVRALSEEDITPDLQDMFYYMLFHTGFDVGKIRYIMLGSAALLESFEQQAAQTAKSNGRKFVRNETDSHSCQRACFRAKSFRAARLLKGVNL